MKQIYLMRHAHASDEADVPDHDRALSERGVDEAKTMSRWISDSYIKPSVVLCSTANRCQQTYGLVEQLCGLKKPHYVDNLYLASAGDLITKLQMIDDAFASVLLVGHNPGLAELARSFEPAEHLKQGDRDALIRFSPTTFVSASSDIQNWSDAAPHNITLTQCTGIGA